MSRYCSRTWNRPTGSSAANPTLHRRTNDRHGQSLQPWPVTQEATMNDVTIFDVEATTAGLPFDALVKALEEGFAAGCELPERHHHRIERPGEPDATLLLMPAWTRAEDPQQYLGVKIVTVYPGNVARSLPGLVSTYILYD